jgi:hypothetical protein
VRVRTRSLDGVGERAWLLQTTASWRGGRMHATTVVFSEGNALGSATMARPDRAPPDRDVVTLAVELRARMLDVAAGRGPDEPVPLPALEEEPLVPPSAVPV